MFTANSQAGTAGKSTRSVHRSGHALRLINTKTLPQQDWLAIRKQGIGSSDAAAAIGLNPYQSALALWLEKTGRDAMLAKPDADDDSQPMYWGSLLEPLVAAQYAKRSGNRVRKVNAVLQHPDYPWMLANIDREVIGNAEVQILECKTAGIHGSRLWQHGVPEYVQIQVMHQLAVTGHQAADVAVLMGGQTLQLHRIHRDEALIAQLIELEQQFWHYVSTDTAPSADGSTSAEQALRCLFPQDSGEDVDLTLDADLNHVFEQLVHVRQAIKQHETEESRLRQRIEQTMGSASQAIFRNGSVSWKRSKDSMVLDTERLRAQYPELMAAHQTRKPGSRRFLLHADM